MKRLQLVVPAIVLATAACLFSAGCRSDSSAKIDSRGGLLVNPAFERGVDGVIMSWAFNQHAGERSYRFDIDAGTLVIERVGPEPWGQAIQMLSAAGLAGRTLEFSAEISGAFSDQSGAPLSPTGVGVRINGRRPGLPAALDDAILSTRHGAPAIGVGDHGWTVQRVVFEVPDTATEIQLSLQLTLDGTLRVRNPRLIPVTL